MQVTSLYNKHKELGAKMVPFAGFEMPVQYSGLIDEHFAVRERVGIFDVSHMGQFFIEGPGSLELLQWVTTNNVATLVDGQAQYSCFPNYTGGIVDDLIVYRISAEKYFVVVNASNIQKDWNHITNENRFGASLKNVSDQTSLIAIQGPKAINTLQKITPIALSDIAYYHFTIGEIGGKANVIISNTGYTGSGGFEIYFPNEYADDLWDIIIDAGQEFDILPCGLGARDTLRLEKGFCLYGNDIDDTTSPIEAGLGWITKFDKDFISKETFLNQKTNGPSKKLVAFEMQEKAIPRHDYPVIDSSGNIIGRVTSGTQSPMKKIGIGMAYIPAAQAKIGNEIFIQIRNKTIGAKIVKLPFV